MTTQGKQLRPADAKADTQGLPSQLHCCCCCSRRSTAHFRNVTTTSDTMQTSVDFFLGLVDEWDQRGGERWGWKQRMREKCVYVWDWGCKARQTAVPFSGALWHFCWAVVTHGGSWWRTRDRNADPVGQSPRRSADASVSAGLLREFKTWLPSRSRNESLTSSFKRAGIKCVCAVTTTRRRAPPRNNPGFRFLNRFHRNHLAVLREQ